MFHRLFIAGSILTSVVLTAVTPAVAQIKVFSQGEGTPETITLAPAGFGIVGGEYLVPDANGGKTGGSLYAVNATTGVASVFATEPDVPRTGLFLPDTGWGSFSGDFVTFGQDASSPSSNLNGTITAYTADGSSSLFAGVNGSDVSFSGAVFAPPGFSDGMNDYTGDILAADEDNNQLFAVAPDGTTKVISTTLPTDPFGLVSAPTDFGAFAGQVLVSSTNSGQIDTISADGATSLFANLPLATGQTGLRQMAFSSPGFLPGYGSLLFVSLSGSMAGGGTAGDVLALDASGNVVASLREAQGFTKFDPRGLYFTSDGQLLISDASDPIDIVSASDFQSGLPGATPEPSSVAAFAVSGLGLAGLMLKARRRAAA